MSNFKPMLAPNEKVELRDMKLPLIVSFKLDGIRCIFKDGEMYTRALKPFPNIKIRERFAHLAQFSKEENIILDGELLSKSLTFNELSGLVRQLDKELPEDLNFYCFDCIKDNNFSKEFKDRIIDIGIVESKISTDGVIHQVPYFIYLSQWLMNDYNKIEEKFSEALAWGCDGLILRNPNSHYKFGRGTIKEALIYKLKPFQTFDAEIINILQGTIVDPKAEKKINELGNSVTSKKKDDRILIDRACDFVVMYEGRELKVSIAMTNEEKEEVWKNRKSYIGRMIEYKGMIVGAKDLPRHPVFLRFRNDKED